MSTTVGQMSKDELREMIEALIEQKLLELLGDPDKGLELRKSLRERLVRQKKAVARGERGEPFGDAVRRLGLAEPPCIAFRSWPPPATWNGWTKPRGAGSRNGS